MNEKSEPMAFSPGAPAKKSFSATEEEKAEWVRRFRESGLSLRKFSVRHAVPLMSLWRWVNQPKGFQAIAAGSAQPEFTEIKLPASLVRSDWAAGSHARSTAARMLSCSSGTRVFVATGPVDL